LNHFKEERRASFYCDCPLLRKEKCVAYSQEKNIYNKTIFMLACENKNISFEILRVLSKTVDFSINDKEKNNALHYICSMNLKYEFLSIFTNFVEMNKENILSQQPLHLALKNEHLTTEICLFFISKNYKPLELLEIHLKYLAPRYDIVKFLIEKNEFLNLTKENLELNIVTTKLFPLASLCLNDYIDPKIINLMIEKSKKKIFFKFLNLI
jgi:hypothetical protein